MGHHHIDDPCRCSYFHRMMPYSKKQINIYALEAVVVFLGSGIFFYDTPNAPRWCLPAWGCTIPAFILNRNSGIHIIFNRSDVSTVICRQRSIWLRSIYVEFTQTFKPSQADIINIQEVTPGLVCSIKDALRESISYHTDLNRIDPMVWSSILNFQYGISIH